MQAVLISIQPGWCELIASGKKTVEVRKTKPKLETPFKVYIYCTNSKERLWVLKETERAFTPEKIASICAAKDVGGTYKANGKVIGEFICDRIVDIPYSRYYVDYYHAMPQQDFEDACLDMGLIDEYLRSKDGFGWHISDLKIYDKPRELSEFSKYGFGHPVPLKRPPQSWMYVEAF